MNIAKLRNGLKVTGSKEIRQTMSGILNKDTRKFISLTEASYSYLATERRSVSKRTPENKEYFSMVLSTNSSERIKFKGLPVRFTYGCKLDCVNQVVEKSPMSCFKSCILQFE